MKPARFLTYVVLVLLLFAQLSMSQNHWGGNFPEKVRDILTIQDRRAPNDGKLREYLSDSSVIVRERVMMAYASLQDTNAIPLLVDKLNDEYAVFALGQSAGLLSAGSISALEHDLIWARLDRIENRSAHDRLIEEIGKFGDQQALTDLFSRFGTDGSRDINDAFVMSIARFAIRSIVNADATQYLVNLARNTDTVPWKVIYALQRIGNQLTIRDNLRLILPLYLHPDPLARMHFATLLGKVKDQSTSIAPLCKLAEFDSDWRVRINAIKALGNFDLTHEQAAIAMMNRLFFVDNVYVPITAISIAGNLSLRESGSPESMKMFESLKKISLNDDGGYVWQVQVEASMALAKLIGPDAARFINLAHASSKQAQARMLTALGTTGSEVALNTLLSYADDSDPLLSRSALDGMQEFVRINPKAEALGEKIKNSCLKALKSGDVAVTATAASILGDSLLMDSKSVKGLLDALDRLRVPQDVEAIQEICGTLGKLKDRQARISLERTLNLPDRSVKFAALKALKEITGREYSTEMRVEPLYTDFDFRYLEALPKPLRVKMETARGDVVMELNPADSPFTIMSFLKLATERGFFRGRTFHRVVPNFVVQGGDPRGDGYGGPEYSLRSEFSPKHYETGTVGIASAGKDTEGSQFFITQSPQPHLDGKYTIIGSVISGMDVVNKIQVDDHIYDIKILQ